MTPLKPDQPIAVTLEAQQWNTVLAALQEAPMPSRLTNPPLQRILAQIEQQQTDEATSVASSLPAKPNGADEHVPH